MPHEGIRAAAGAIKEDLGEPGITRAIIAS